MTMQDAQKRTPLPMLVYVLAAGIFLMGTTEFMLAGLLSGQRFASTLVGDESLSARPMARVTDDERSRMHDDHAYMLEAFVARDADELVRRSAEHYQRLERAVDTL